MIQTLRSLILGLIAIVLCLPLGCAGRIDLEREGLLLGEISTKAIAPLTPIQLAPFLTSQGSTIVHFDVVAGKNQGEILVERTESIGEGHWVIELVRTLNRRPLEQHSLTQRDDGALVLGSITKYDRGLVVEMSPAPVALPAQLIVGEPVRSEMSMRLPTLDNPEILRGLGTGAIELTLLGTQRVIYAGSPHRAWLVREVFTTNLGISGSRRVTDRWYVPDVGLVLEKWEETVKALGLVIERSKRALQRIAPSDL